MESTVLGMLLSAQFPGADALREQARYAVAVGRCDCGCPSVYLEVSTEVPAVGGSAGFLRGYHDSIVIDDQAEEIREVLLAHTSSD